MSKKIVRYSVISFVFIIILLLLNNNFHSHRLSLSEDRSKLLYLSRLSLVAPFKESNEAATLAKKIRMHQEMWEAYYFYNASKLLSVDEENILLKSLQVQEKIYPFNRVYYKSVWDLYSNYTGKGIVMTSGNWYTK